MGNVFFSEGRADKRVANRFLDWSLPGSCTTSNACEKNVIPNIIPKGITGKVQPLDVYGFRIWKNYVRHFSDSVILLDYDLNRHIRNKIIKLQSHNQLSSPRYHSLFKYSWFKSGYDAEKPGEFENPVDFSFKTFSNTLCKISEGQNVAAIRCSWCRKS